MMKHPKVGLMCIVEVIGTGRYHPVVCLEAKEASPGPHPEELLGNPGAVWWEMDGYHREGFSSQEEAKGAVWNFLSQWVRDLGIPGYCYLESVFPVDDFDNGFYWYGSLSQCVRHDQGN